METPQDDLPRGIRDRLTAALEGRYRIEGELGAGGMATVWLAHDRKHDRKVALKVLRPELAAVVGAERFVTEIRTTANLQHPHILPLFDSGEADGFLYYVMPYMDGGETLRDRLDREKQLPVEDALEITGKVASALHAAHERDVVHRDVKPANILLDRRGQPLVADFGIALAVQQAGGDRLTETGLSLGTPYYMSPEQATADRDPDARSDVYSLGCVLYEMLTGDPPHSGSTAQAVIMRILTEEPRDVGEARPSVPGHARHALRRAMEKLPADRFASAADFAAALENPAFRYPALRGAEATFPSGGAPSRQGGWMGPGLAAGSALVLGITFGLLLTEDAGVRDVGLPFEAPMSGGHQDPVPGFAVAPDGSFVVYEADTEDGQQLWYRSLQEPVARPIPGTSGARFGPRISPDGRQVAFMREGAGLAVVSVDGGAPAMLSDEGQAWGGGWLDDGTLFYGGNGGRFLHWVDPETGPIRDVFVEYCQMPVLVSESEVLCGGGEEKFAMMGNLDETPFVLRPIRQAMGVGEPIRLRGSHFRLFDDEYLVYTSVDAAIMATKFVDRDALLVGRPVALVPNVRRYMYTGAGAWDVSRDGALVYAPGANMEVSVLVRRDLDGSGLEVLPGEPAAHLRFNVGPDGRRLASVVEAVRGHELRLYDLESGRFEALAAGLYIGTPFWGPGGRHLVYELETAEGSALYRHRLDSVERPEPLLVDVDWGDVLLQYVDSATYVTGDFDVGVYVIDSTTDPPRTDTIGAEGKYFARLSPDRRFIVWRDETPTLYLGTWPALDRRWALGTGPFEPYWLSNGDMLVHLVDGSVHTVEIDPELDPPYGEFQLRFRDPRKGDTPGWSTTVTTDDRIIHPLMPDQLTVEWLRVIPGWIEAMKRAVDEANR